MDKVINLLNEADKEIKLKHRYFCGLSSPIEIDPSWGKEKIRVFFESPDGQNGELYYTLTNKGLMHSKYEAPYYWKVRDKMSGWIIAYTEGDIDIYQDIKKC